MIKIYFSKQNLPEKVYLSDIIFNEFLGVGYQYEISDENNYILEFPGNKKIIIEDHFWIRTQKNELSYLREGLLPQNISFAQNQFTFENDLPVLYGNPEIKIEKDAIHCSIDIFASIYFFLTRWEEYISTERDKMGRFQYKNSISAKFGTINRPVVNELIEFLWKMLLYSGYQGARKMHQFTPFIMHDIDQPIRLYNLKILLRTMGKNIFVHKNIVGAVQNVFVYTINKITPKYDLANCYDFLMKVSESIGTKSYFIFQSTEKTKYDWGYDINSKFLQNTFENIKNKGHLIGYHPGFYTLENSDLWKKDYEKLCETVKIKVLIGRQHYLRFRVPFTWQIWEDNGLELDATLGYPEMEGFRCGTCFQYSAFNFLQRKKLKLKELPLIFMDVSLWGYQKIYDPKTFFEKFDSLANTVRKYNGNFVFLWHNSSFDRSLFTKDFYMELLLNLK